MVVALPEWITVLVVLFDLLVAVLVTAGVAGGARRAGLPSRTRRRLTAATAGVLVVWLVAAAAVASARLGPEHPLVLGLIGGPVLVGYGLFLLSPTWRRVVRAVPQRWLVGGQAYRPIGVVFLVVWGLGGLPAYFAVPAGVGDIVTGVGALVVLALLVVGGRGERLAVAGWNAVGLADLVVAVGAGAALLAGPLTVLFAAETSTQLVTWLPLGLIPMFLVPISAVLHLYSLTNLSLDARTTAAQAADERPTERSSP